MKNSLDLLELAQKQERLAEELDAKIGEAALVGDDLDDLTHQKAAALSKANAYRVAIKSAKEIEDRERLKVERQVQNKALGQVTEDAEAVLDAAEEVDAAMVALEQHYETLALRILDLQRSLRLSGNSDQSRLATQLKPSIRWALAHFAPNLTEAAGVPRVTNARRKSLAESLSNLIPHLPDDGEAE